MGASYQSGLLNSQAFESQPFILSAQGHKSMLHI